MLSLITEYQGLLPYVGGALLLLLVFLSGVVMVPDVIAGGESCRCQLFIEFANIT